MFKIDITLVCWYSNPKGKAVSRNTCWNLTCSRVQVGCNTRHSKIKPDWMIMQKSIVLWCVWAFNTSGISCRRAIGLSCQGQTCSLADESTSHPIKVSHSLPSRHPWGKKALFSSHCAGVGQQVFWSQLYYIVLSLKWKHGKWERVESASCRSVGAFFERLRRRHSNCPWHWIW